MVRLRSLPAVCVVVAIVAACTTSSAARGTSEPSTRMVSDGGQQRLAEDVARELVLAGDDAVARRDDKAARTAFRRVVDEFADTRARGPATVALARLLLGDHGEERESGAAEAQHWLERFLLEDPTADDAEDARSLLARAQLAQGDARSAAPAIKNLVDSLPEDERGPALLKLGRELIAAGQAKDGVIALLTALPSLGSSQRPGVEADILAGLDIPQAQGGLSFNDVRSVREQFAASDPFADEVLTWKLVRVEVHLRDDAAASALAQDLIRKHPTSRFTSTAKALVTQLAARVEVNTKAIGIILPLSGEYAAYGKRALVAIRLAFNLNGSVGSDEPELDPTTGELVRRKATSLAGTLRVPAGPTLIIKDSAGRADVAAAAVRDLVEQDHVVAVLGDILIDTALPIALACEDYGVPLISLSRKDGVPEAGPWSFRLALTPKKQAEALAEYAVDGMKLKRFGVMYPKHAFGVELMGYFWDALDARHAEITAIESYAHDQTTFTNEAKSLVGRGIAGGGREVLECRNEARAITNDYRRKKALESCRDRAKPIIDFEALFIPDSYRAVSFVVPALVAEDVLMTNARYAVEAYRKATGNEKVRPVQLLGASTWNDPELAERLGRQVDGAVFVDGFNAEDQTPLVQNFVQGFNKGARSRPSLLEAQVYDAARLLGTILEGQGPKGPIKRPTSRRELKTALDDVQDFVGVTGAISFDAQGESTTPLHFFKIEREKVEQVDVRELVKGAG